MSKKIYVREMEYSNYHNNRDQNEKRKVRKPKNRNQMKREYPSGNSRSNRSVREYEFSNEKRNERIRKSRNTNSTRERYYHSKNSQRAHKKELTYLDNRKVQKTSKTLLFSFLWTLIFYTFTVGIIVTAIMFSFSSQSNASIFGYRFYTVLTNSMVPQKDGPKDGFYAGDVVIMKMMDGEKVQKGDIVTFPVGDSGQRYLTHRVVDKRTELNGEPGDYVVTKGDANESNDPPLEAKKIIGKVIFSVPKMGLLLDFIREEFWACLVSAMSLYGFFLVLKAYFFPRE